MKKSRHICAAAFFAEWLFCSERQIRDRARGKMSIVINLIVIPRRISPDKWKEVYEESLKLLQAYDFMDRFPAQRNGLTYDYAAKSRDRENFLNTGYHGWRSVGDMRTGGNTEDYILFGDIHAYLSSSRRPDNGREILLGLLEDMKAPEKPRGCMNLWGGRTEGEDSHIYLLAVGCLFASRFPEAVAVTGSISAGQCRKAVRWANQYLDKDIRIPDTGSKDRLLERLKSTSMSHRQIIEAFFQLTIEARTQKMGAFLREEFTDKEISSYYRQRLVKFRPDQRGFAAVLKEYLEMGFSFEELCRLAVCDSRGPKSPPEEFIAHIMNFRLYIKEKETGDFTKFALWDEDCEEVDSRWQEMGKILGMLCGAGNQNVNAFYPLENIRRDCRKAFEGRCDADSVIDGFLEAEKKAEKANRGRASLQAILYDLPHSLFGQGERKAGGQEEKKYDVNTYQETIDFFPGCSIRPELEADLMKNFKAIHEFAEAEFDSFRALDRKERENYLITGSRRVLLRKNIWDRIFEKIMDDKYIIRIFGIFCVNTEMREGYLFCRNILSGLDAVDYFWERTADEI